ncbi:hypothetical protein AYI70_g7641 [Smittium culicis]|uniref:Uncharacterized protein n=1 Tax=Smittium culicis TaxID=133412 RepID=A0A1R1XJP0_9FUNG|nr:hypothetical protein AYI70_g7641 [Smittium culicis]
MGSDRKVGMSWSQFKDEGHGAVNTMGIVSKHFTGTYYIIQENFRNRVTYYIFHNVSNAEKMIKNFIYRQGIKIEFYQTELDIITMIDIIKSQLENSGEIKDISTLARKGTGEFLPYCMKILFKKKSVDTDLSILFFRD